MTAIINNQADSIQTVMHFHKQCGIAELGYGVPNQILQIDRPGLSEKEMQQVVAFMETLTDPLATDKKSLSTK